MINYYKGLLRIMWIPQDTTGETRMTDTIIKMLCDPESDNDELNARIYAYVGKMKYIRVFKKRGTFQCYHPVYKKTKVEFPYRCTKYTTSLDAAMSIGENELGGWHLTRTVEMLDDESFIFSTAFTSADGETQFVSHIEDLHRAICHARISALEYVRTQND